MFQNVPEYFRVFQNIYNFSEIFKNILRYLKKSGKRIICNKSYFFWLNLYCTYSQFSFDVYNTSVAQIWNLNLFGFKNFIFDLRHSRKSTLHRGLILVTMEIQRSKYLIETMFRVVGGLWVNSWQLKSIRAIQRNSRLPFWYPASPA